MLAQCYIVLLFGGGFALAAGFVSSGLDRYLVSGFDVLHDVPLLVLIAAIAFAMTFLTELTSNTASTQMILPVLAAAAGARELHPLYLMLPATLAASVTGSMGSLVTFPTSIADSSLFPFPSPGTAWLGLLSAIGTYTR